MKTTKQISSVLIALVMLFSLFSFGVNAWNAGEGIDVYWNGEKVGTVAYEVMEEHIQNPSFGEDTYSNNKGEYTGKLYKFSKLLSTAGVKDAWAEAPSDTTVELISADSPDKTGSLTKAELDEERYYFKDGAQVNAVSPGFLLESGNDYFRFVYGQKTADDSTSGNFIKFKGTGNAAVKITTSDASEPGDDEEQTDGIAVYWNDKPAGNVYYEQMFDDVSQATSKVTYSARNKNGYRTVEGYVYKFSQLLEAVQKDGDWDKASDNTQVIIAANKEKSATFTKKELTETRYYYLEDGTPVEKVKPGFMDVTENDQRYFRFMIGQSTSDEWNWNRCSSFKDDGLTEIRIYTPLTVVDADGNSTAFSFDQLQELWQEEGSPKYNYSNFNTYPEFEMPEYYGPTLKTVLAKANIDLDALGDNDVIHFESTDSRYINITGKDIKETRYCFPNAADKKSFAGTTEAELEGKSEVPFIISITNGKSNLRPVFGQRDPQEEQRSSFIKYLTSITITKDGATEYTGLTPTIPNGSQVYAGDKLNFDVALKPGEYEGFVYYTVSTDGTEPADPTFSDILYNFAQNREDGQDYLKPEKAKFYNSYEFTDAEKTIIKVFCYVSGYKPMTTTLTYYKNVKQGFVKDEDGVIRYYTNGKVDTGVTDVKYDTKTGNWYNTVKGIVTPGPTVAHNAAGWWYIDKTGKVDFGYTGTASNSAGKWYCKDGKVDFSVNGVVYAPNEGVWYYVKNNKVTPGPTVQPNAAGWWYIDKTGKVDFNHFGVEHNDAGWWRIENGKVNFNFNGIASNAAGSWYLQGGKVDFNKNGRVYYNGAAYNIKGGKVV